MKILKNNFIEFSIIHNTLRIMQLSKSFGGSIFYIQNNRKIFEYDIITKQKYLRCKTKTRIYNYYISHTDKVIIALKEFRYDFQKLTIIWNDKNFDVPVYFFSEISFITIDHRIYVVCCTNDSIITCDSDGNIAHYNGHYIYVSGDMEQVVFIKNRQIFFFERQ